MESSSLTGVYLVQGGQMARATNRDGRLALAAMQLLQDRSHLTSDDIDRRLADYQSGMDEAAARKRAAINLLPLRVVAPDAAPRREWPVVTTVECGLRRYDNGFGEAAEHLLKAERAKDDGRAALRESRRTLARAEDAEARGRALLRRAWGWIAVGAGLAVGNAAWTAAAIIEMHSRPLAAVIAGCAFVVALLEVERAGKGRRARK